MHCSRDTRRHTCACQRTACRCIQGVLQVVIYDRSGVFSAPRVWWTFRAFGHKRWSSFMNPSPSRVSICPCSGPCRCVAPLEPLLWNSACRQVRCWMLWRSVVSLLSSAEWRCWMADCRHGRQRATLWTCRLRVRLMLTLQRMQRVRPPPVPPSTQQSCRSASGPLQLAYRRIAVGPAPESAGPEPCNLN